MALQFSAASSGSMVYTDEFDTSVATLNLVCSLGFLCSFFEVQEF